MLKKDTYYRPPTELGSAIEEFFKKFGYEKEYLQGKIMADWKDIVGEAMASRVKILSFDSDILTVKTENSVWKNEVFLRKAELVKLINNRYNQKIVTEIYIK
jgi:hypothetical protein